MKTRLNALVLALAGSLCLVVIKAPANVNVSVGVQVNAVADFQAPLAPHGAWVEVGSYGRCWRPAHVAVGWRPYCDGHWEWTDCGWYWVSDEPWAWACYHYGSWYFDSFNGWVWVPGVEWAPAWVYWRVGGGHIGWAPCGPRGVVVAPSLFVFVGAGQFHERVRPTTVIVNNTTIINKTTQITEIKRETRNIGGRTERVVVNEGPGVDVVQQATRQKFAAIPVQEVDRRTSVPTEVKRKTIEPAAREQSPERREQPRLTPERTTPPAANPPANKATPPTDKPSKAPDKVSPTPDRKPPPAEKSSPHGKRIPPSRKHIGPPPSQPPAHTTPPTEKPDSSKGNEGKEPDHEKQKGPDQDKP